MKLLMEDKLKGKKAGKVEAALDAVGGGGIVVEGVSGEISSLIERLIMEDMLSRTIAPGMPMTMCSCVGRTSLPHWRAAAGILDDFIHGSPQAARAKAALLLQLDQAAIDKGEWTLAGELSLERPFHNMCAQAIADGESPYSRLLDPRWSEIALAHPRDTEE